MGTNFSDLGIVDVGVDWNNEYDNSPRLRITIDGPPPEPESFRYTEKDNLYLAVKDGFARYYYYKELGDGFYGRKIPITMADGTEKILEGPWSSRAGHVNRTHDQQVVDVAIQYNKYGLFSGAITLELAMKLAPLAGVGLARVEHVGDIVYVPHVNGIIKVDGEYDIILDSPEGVWNVYLFECGGRVRPVYAHDYDDAMDQVKNSKNWRLVEV